ncbi:hypothetical protein DL765_009862 [Monosporascus sp. GIB2]|nr:hypothetical protein DL765_009862 [Monosporascus sp. GIB2]
MPLLLPRAHRADAGRIAEIHTAAFGSNAMLRAQFPMPALHEALKEAIKAKAVADINDPKTTVLVVRDLPDPYATGIPGNSLDQQKDDTKQQREGLIVAFAKWSHPVSDGEDYTEPPWAFPDGTNWDILEDWARKMEEAQRRALGGMPCYRMITPPF